MESSSSTSSKRRRLMQSYISLQRSDLPAIFESLNDDTKRLVLQFVGNKSYVTYAGTNKQCREVYLNTPGMTKETFLFGYGPLSAIIDKIERGGRFYQMLHKRVGKGVLLYNRRDVMDWALQERKKLVLCGICEVAAVEGRIDLLNEVWNNEEDEHDKEDVFGSVDYSAARHGKLNVLKWLETKESLYIWKEGCARYAAEKGHLNIIQWLKEEQGFELDRGLYYGAIDGGHVHVMKWLKANKVPWYDSTFEYAAKEGNLDTLQWLHNEGFPWDHSVRVSEIGLKPEVIDWLMSNGYGDRIIS